MACTNLRMTTRRSHFVIVQKPHCACV